MSALDLAVWQDTQHLNIHKITGMDSELEYAPVTIFEDNQDAIVLSKNPVFCQRCKYTDIKFHFVRSVVGDGKIHLRYCPTVNMAGYKPAPKVRSDEFVSFLFGS